MRDDNCKLRKKVEASDTINYEISKKRADNRKEGLKKGFLINNSTIDGRKKSHNEVEIVLDSSGDSAIDREIEEFKEDLHSC